MYSQKIEEILNDLENKEIEVAGGSVVGIVLATINSLIKYIANLTQGKKNYENVQNKIQEILLNAQNLKENSIKSIDKDVEILEHILVTYKTRKEKPEEYENACKEATEFALDVVELAYKTLHLCEEISQVGNKMLASDFKICKYYAQASVEASKENLYVNLNGIKDEEYKEKVYERIALW